MGKLLVGVDLVEVARVRRALERTPALKRRLFTEDEIAYCERRGRPEQSYAARFAAREAVLKALGCGFSGVGWKDVSVAIAEDGHPEALLEGAAKARAEEAGVEEVALSLSHTDAVACANAVLITHDARPEKKVRAGERDALASSFKEARSIVLELERAQREAEDERSRTAKGASPQSREE